MARGRGEQFEIFDDLGQLCGLAPRDEVHRLGFWHRSADVWLFRADGAMLVQRRAADKDLFPGRWDYSVGEHLLPGESFPAGAARGLAEELGIRGAVLTAVGGLRRVISDYPELGILDRELSRSFRACCEAELRPASAEVEAIQWVFPEALRSWMQREPQAFTPWFLAAVDAVGAPLGLPVGGRKDQS